VTALVSKQDNGRRGICNIIRYHGARVAGGRICRLAVGQSPCGRGFRAHEAETRSDRIGVTANRQMRPSWGTVRSEKLLDGINLSREKDYFASSHWDDRLHEVNPLGPHCGSGGGTRTGRTANGNTCAHRAPVSAHAVAQRTRSSGVHDRGGQSGQTLPAAREWVWRV